MEYLPKVVVIIKRIVESEVSFIRECQFQYVITIIHYDARTIDLISDITKYKGIYYW